MENEAILSGIKVLDLGNYVAGPYAGKLLADNGAEVVKIEKPGEGDIARRCGPFPNDTPDAEASGLFLALNTSKKGITLDITSHQGRELFLKLVSKIDAVIENFPPQFLSSLGLGYKNLAGINPRLVMTSISGFGQNGPFRDWQATEITLQAAGGIMSITGEPDRPPVKVGIQLAHYLSGLTAFTSTLAALYHAQETGEGQQVDVAMCDAIPTNIDERSYAWAMDPEKVIRGRTGERRGPAYGLYQCQDGFIGCATVNFGELRRLSDFVCPELDDETMFGDFFWGSTAHADDLEAMLVPCFFEHKREEIVDIAQGRGLPWSYVANTRDLVEANPHLKARGSLVEMEHPRAGKLLYFVPCNRFSEIGTRLLPAPFLGQHNEEIFGGWLGLTKNDITKLAEAGII